MEILIKAVPLVFGVVWTLVVLVAAGNASRSTTFMGDFIPLAWPGLLSIAVAAGLIVWL